MAPEALHYLSLHYATKDWQDLQKFLLLNMQLYISFFPSIGSRYTPAMYNA
jgi:hypothetical protein